MNIDLSFYWKLFLRRLPVMALLVTVCTALGVFTAIRLPTTYSTSARLLVEDPQIPDGMVASTVRISAPEQLDIIRQRLTTRANLIDIANEYNVIENIRAISPDDVVEEMRESTGIRLSTGRDQAIIMSINFEGRSGKVVADVVNEYVTLVMEANLDFRMSRAEDTLDFFEQEVDRLNSQLDEQSVRITAFKAANAAALPENQPYRLGRQSLLLERIPMLERDLATATTQRDEFERIFQNTGSVNQGDQPRALSIEEQQLENAKNELVLALAVYSEDNPRIVQMRAMIERLETIVAGQQTAGVNVEVPADASPQEAVFQATIIEMDNRIASIEADILRTTEEIAALQVAISDSAANEIQLSALERDYNNIQDRYNSAINNFNAAQMSEQIETSAQGRRITVIENAVVPSEPSGPNRPRVIATGAVLGLGLAGGFFMLLEILNRTIRRPVELVNRFNVMPITTIPYLESKSRRMSRRLMLFSATLVAIIGVPLALWYIDTNYMPLDIFVQKVLSRLGLG